MYWKTVSFSNENRGCLRGRLLLTRLNVVDRLYLFYLAAIGLLALRGGAAGWRVLAWHAAIAIAILLLAMNQSRLPVLGFLHDWYPLAMFIFSFEEVARFSLSLVGHWQDHRIAAFEYRFFAGSPNLWLRQFASRPVSELMDFGYFTYYPMFPLLAGLLYGHGKRDLFRLLMVRSVTLYFIAFTIYLGFPCESPRRAFYDSGPLCGYFFSWIVRLIQGGAGVHGNALPSSHVGLAVLCTWVAYQWNKKLGLLFSACTVLIGTGAVYDGYHYVSDVLAGVVVAGAANALTTRFFPESS